MGTYRHSISYSMDVVRREVPGLSAKELEKQNRSGCDALLFIPIMFPPGVVPSAEFKSLDGRTGEPLSSADLFSAWLAFAKSLGDNVGLDEDQRAYAHAVYQTALARDRSLLRGQPGGVAET